MTHSLIQMASNEHISWARFEWFYSNLERLPRWSVTVICWTTFPCEFYTLSLLAIPFNVKPFPRMTIYTQRGGWKRSVLPTSLNCPFKYKMNQVRQLFSKNHLRHFPLRMNPSFYHVSWSRNETEIKNRGALLSATIDCGEQKKPFYSWTLGAVLISENPSLPTRPPLPSSQNKKRNFLLWGLVRNHRRTLALSPPWTLIRMGNRFELPLVPHIL